MSRRRRIELYTTMASAAFSPTTPIGGSVHGAFWWQPGASQTLVNSNTMISAWSDSFGGGNNLAKSGANAGLTYGSVAIGTNGIGTVGGAANINDIFVGPNILTMMGGGSAVSAEYFMVIRVADSATLWTPGWGGVGGPNTGVFTFSTDHHIYDDFGAASRNNFATTGFTPPAAFVYSVLADSTANGGWKAFINGTQVFSNGTNTVTFANASLNLFGQAGSVNSVTALGEAMGYWSAAAGGIGSVNRANNVSYLRTKWGI